MTPETKAALWKEAKAIAPIVLACYLPALLLLLQRAQPHGMGENFIEALGISLAIEMVWRPLKELRAGPRRRSR